MKYKVIGWTFSDNHNIEDAPLSFAARHAIVDEIKAHGYLFSGEDHQDALYGCPVLNDGKKRACSQRGFAGIMAEAQAAMDKLDVSDPEYTRRNNFLTAVIESCEAVIHYARRYAALAKDMAKRKNAPFVKRSLKKSPQTVPVYPNSPQEISTKRVSLSGSYSFYCRLNPADIPSLPVVSINTCTPSIKKISTQVRLRSSRRKNLSTVFG